MVLGLSTFEGFFFFSLQFLRPEFVTKSSVEVWLSQLRSAQLMGGNADTVN